MYCTKCGRDIVDQKDFVEGKCGWCGEDLPEEIDPIFEYNENQK
jgi:predicted RNA-binding Zn-ribbon protein involved in translation (DUF1610 family)